MDGEENSNSEVPAEEAQEPIVQIQDPTGEFKKLFDRQFYFIIGVMLIGFLTLLFIVGGLVIEAWRFNSTLYKGYKQTETQKDVGKNIIKNQEVLIKQTEKQNEFLGEVIKGQEVLARSVQKLEEGLQESKDAQAENMGSKASEKE